MNSKHHCDCYRAVELLGHDASMLTGWTSRVIKALAHLREAWCVADRQNRPWALESIACLMAPLTLNQSNALPLAKCVLTMGLDPQLADRLLGDVEGVLAVRGGL